MRLYSGPLPFCGLRKGYKMKKYLNWIIGLVCCLLVSGVYYYINLPPINVHAPSFWMFWVIVIASFSLPVGLFSALMGKIKRTGSFGLMPKILVMLILLPVVFVVLGGLFSSTFFNAKRYAAVIDVQDAVFEEDMPETTTVTNIALMDSESARILGNRTLGSLSEVVSQYEAGRTYNQINYQGAPQKVTSLEYVDFFKWFNNRKQGVPGYIMVDPVNNTASYVKTPRSIKYVSSAYFNDKLERKLRFEYPTKIFGSYSFEIDEQGNPYYIVSCMKPRVGLFGAMDVSEVIVFDPCDGSSEIYSVQESPVWIDEVYTGALATQKYNWYGMYAGGYWNSVIGNKDCKKTTDDFGYITLEDDVWYFTGVTSIVSDESNIGFIITNARTGEYKFYPVVGAEEYSAMAAAEGEVQEKGYRASFPALVNISGKASYILVLKDDGGLVKLYALVNVENYSIVATGQTQAEAISAYKKLLVQNGVVSGDGQENQQLEETVTVSEVRIASIEGSSVVYLLTEDNVLYKSYVSDDETLMMIKTGDVVKVQYTQTALPDVRYIDRWSFAEEESADTQNPTEQSTSPTGAE